MVTALPDVDEFLHEEEREYLRSFRRELNAAQMFAHRPVRGLHITKMKWREISDAGKVKVSMEFPALEGQDGLTITEKEVELPVFTKDLTYGGRAYQAYLDAGLDLEDARQAGLSMAEEIDKYLLFGGEATGHPGPATGLLNNADRLVVDNSAATNWNNPTDVSDDLADGIKELLVAGHTPARRSRLALMMNPADSDLLVKWRAETDKQTRDLISPLIGTEPIFDRLIGDASDVGAGKREAFLIAMSPDNFDAVGAFAPGQVQTLVDDPGVEGMRMGKKLWIRHLSSIVPRVTRGDCVARIVFDRA